MTRPNVVSVGAFDRFNYGDLLFPLVLDSRWAALTDGTLSHYALWGARGTGWGTARSGSARDLRRRFTEQPPTGCVVAGGEVLSATWYDLTRHSVPSGFDLAVAALHRSVPRRQLSRICRTLAGGMWDLPLVPDPATSRQVPVVYNAVGATSVDTLSGDDRSRVLGSLRASKYLSVRDNSSVDILRSHGIDADLSPDSAAVIDRLFPATPKRSRTLVFQCSRQWLRGHEDEVVTQLRALSERYEISLLAIGLAGGHSDLTALRRLYRQLSRTTSRVRLVKPANVRDVAAEIASADCYVGTSLHGSITAIAYGTAVVGLDRIPKLSEYLATWAPDSAVRDVSASAIVESVYTTELFDSRDLVDVGRRLSKASAASTDRMLSALLEAG
ncbi:polysaccharide pyruvyl transferase family protein [Rhodococcus sp. JS3073]|uniref:polysaccharide pyruvyl transferase family protein n=1 Tax=Rhodococcus sp. JS3073 TaxID=3002901 RepID=UPI0022856ED2|nr:polysaccharide pyruvyl transferase family protein [Rhodococcus sp. JS3073]WAM16866.1 polysaccharide pyruvyl transferase family protein [Rhodococcus sp. JS3073]